MGTATSNSKKKPSQKKPKNLLIRTDQSGLRLSDREFPKVFF